MPWQPCCCQLMDLKVRCVASCETHGVGGPEEEKASGQILPCHPCAWPDTPPPRVMWSPSAVTRAGSESAASRQGTGLPSKGATGFKGEGPLRRRCADRMAPVGLCKEGPPSSSPWPFCLALLQLKVV